MIVDVHAHIWPTEEAFSLDFVQQAERARGGPVRLVTNYEDYWRDAPPDTRVILFGGKARLSGLWQDDRAVAEMVRTAPDRYVGFLSVDLADPCWREELEYGCEELKLRGVKLMPMYGGFYPQERRFDAFWEYVTARQLPVLLHTGTTFVRQAPLDCTLPRHLDDVAIRFRDARIIMAHLGHPYEAEAVAVIRKHPNVYADISALHYRPWQLFHSLMLVQEYHVWSKLLFGTDFPFTTVSETTAALSALCERSVGGFRIPQDEIAQLIHRNALALLGLQ